MWQISILCCRIMQALILNHGFFGKTPPLPFALWTNALRTNALNQLPSGLMPSANCPADKCPPDNCPLDKCPPDKCPPPIALRTNALHQLPSGQMPFADCPPRAFVWRAFVFGGHFLEGICPEGIFQRAFSFGGHLSRGHLVESIWWRAFFLESNWNYTKKQGIHVRKCVSKMDQKDVFGDSTAERCRLYKHTRILNIHIFGIFFVKFGFTCFQNNQLSIVFFFSKKAYDLE